MDDHFVKFGFASIKSKASEKSIWEKTLRVGKSCVLKALWISPPWLWSHLSLSSIKHLILSVSSETEIHRSACSQKTFSKWKYMTFLIIISGQLRLYKKFCFIFSSWNFWDRDLGQNWLQVQTSNTRIYPGDFMHSRGPGATQDYTKLFFNSGTNLHPMFWVVIFFDLQLWPLGTGFHLAIPTLRTSNSLSKDLLWRLLQLPSISVPIIHSRSGETSTMGPLGPQWDWPPFITWPLWVLTLRGRTWQHFASPGIAVSSDLCIRVVEMSE